MPQINFRVAPLLHERFLAMCEERGVRSSEVLREALERFVDGVDNAQYVARLSVPAEALVRQAVEQGIGRRRNPAVRGFALDGSELPPFGDRLKQEKKAK